jgi:DNA-binding transcriptional ArsR family regulator
VRRQIVEILKEASGATVAELAEKLEMAPVSVRHHLDILQGENLISVGRVERKGNVGRPQQVYSLTAQAMALFPNNFASLAAGLVRQLKQVLPAEQVTVAFTAMAADLANEAHPAQLAELCMEDRLAGKMWRGKKASFCCTSTTAPIRASPANTASSARWIRSWSTNLRGQAVCVFARWWKMAVAAPTGSQNRCRLNFF